MPSTIGVLDKDGLAVTVATIDALNALIGEVQASPTSNTLLDRLKSLNTLLTAIQAVFPTTLDTNSGNKSASTQRVVLATDQPAMTNAQPVTLQAAVTGGATPYHLVSAANTNATVVKGSAGTLKGITAFNINASPRYLKFYDASSTPTAGSGTVVKSILIPGNTAGAGVSVKLPPEGIAFATGIAFVLVTGMADSNSTGVAASEILVELDYK